MAQRLPRAVQEQLDAADVMLTQANTPVTPPAAPPDEPATATAPVVETPPEPTPPQTPATPAPENWEHKYRTLQGVMNSQMPRLQEANKQLGTEVAELRATVEKLSQKPVEPPAPAPDTTKDNDEFGKDLVEMVQRQVRAYTASITARFEAFQSEMKAKLADLDKGVTATTEKVVQTDQELFYAKLDAAVPDWETINTSPQFIAWLEEVDPVYQLPRQAALNNAHSKLDVAKTAAVFNAFKALTAVKTPTPSPMKQVLAGQVAPTGAAATTAPAPQKKEVFTAAQVEAFYREVAQNKWRGREKEAQAMEDRINLALSEGRIQ